MILFTATYVYFHQLYNNIHSNIEYYKEQRKFHGNDNSENKATNAVTCLHLIVIIAIYSMSPFSNWLNYTLFVSAIFAS